MTHADSADSVPTDWTPFRPEPVGIDEWTEQRGGVVLPDHFSATISLGICEPQPQYGLVQLNAYRGKCGTWLSCDVKRDAFLQAVATVLNVTITDAEGSVTAPEAGTP